MDRMLQNDSQSQLGLKILFLIIISLDPFIQYLDILFQ